MQKHADMARNPPAVHSGRLAPLLTVQSVITCLSVSRLCLLHPSLHSPPSVSYTILGMTVRVSPCFPPSTGFLPSACSCQPHMLSTCFYRAVSHQHPPLFNLTFLRCPHSWAHSRASRLSTLLILGTCLGRFSCINSLFSLHTELGCPEGAPLQAPLPHALSLR